MKALGTLFSFNRLLPLAVVLLSCASWFTTFSGFRTVLGEGWLNLVLAVVVTTGAQLILAASAFRLFSTRGMRGRAGAFLTLAFCYLISVGLAFAFYFQQSLGETYTYESAQREVATLSQPIRTLALAYGAATDRLAEAADYSARTAEIERASGGTCGPSLPGPGPRQELRLEDADRLGGFAVYFGGRAGAFDALVEALGDLVEAFDADNIRTIERAIEEARGEALLLAADPKLSELAAYVEGRLEIGRSGFTTASGQLIACPDPQLDAHLNAVKAALAALPAVSEEPIALYDGSDRAAVLKVYSDIGAALAAIAGLGEAPDFDPRQTFPLGLAALVDLLILLVVRYTTLLSGGGWSPIGGLFSRRKPRIDPDFAAAIAEVFGHDVPDLAATLDAFTVRYRRKTSHLVVPTGGTHPLADALAQLALLLEARGVARIRAGGFPTTKLKRRAQSLLGDRLTSTKFVTIYSVPAGLAAAFMDEAFNEAVRRAGKTHNSRSGRRSAAPSGVAANDSAEPTKRKVAGGHGSPAAGEEPGAAAGTRPKRLIVGDDGAVSGIAWPFDGGEDRSGDVILPGAFATPRCLPMLWSHDSAQAIGVWDHVRETKVGLEVSGRLLVDDVPRAREVLALLRAGAVEGLSIGATVHQSTPRPGRGRTISAIEVHEVSIVPVPAHPGARMVDAEARKQSSADPDDVRE